LNDVVVDTSPLQYLHQLGQLGLIRERFTKSSSDLQRSKPEGSSRRRGEAVAMKEKQAEKLSVRGRGPEKGLVSIAGGWKNSESLVKTLSGKRRSRPRRVAKLDSA
jgi:hypothetical protein